jgi:hypothetical protein
VSTQDTRDRTASRASSARAGRAGSAAAPATLKAAAALALLAALATVANAVVALTDGKSLLHSMAADAVTQAAGGQTAGLDFGSLIDDAVNQEYGTLQARAYVGIVIALCYLALFLPVARGARKLRVVASLLAAPAVAMAVIDLRDQTPSTLHMFDIAEIVCAAAMVVAAWLPSSNAYVKARRSRD